MALAGNGVLAIWNGIEAEAEGDFVAWHIREHIPERVAVRGFLRGRRYVAERGHPKYFNFYEVESPSVLVSPDYIARLNAPSDWTKRVVRHFLDTSRTICTVVVSHGLGDGAFAGTLTLSPTVPREVFLEGMAPVLRALADVPSIIAVHLLEGQEAAAGGPSAEKELRKQPDATIAWLLLVEAVESQAIDAAFDEHFGPQSAATRLISGNPFEDLGIYRLQYGLARSQLE